MAGDKPKVAWIHGLGRSRGAIVPFAQALLPDVDCVATNLLGHGDRPVPASLSTEAFAADLLKSYDRAGIQNAYLVGWSYGGRVALHLARHFPHRVRGICLLGMNLEEKHGLGIGLKFYDPDREREHPLTDHQRQLYRAIHSWFAEQVDQPVHLTEQHLKEISTPALIFAGKSDAVVPTRDAEALHSLLPNSRLTLFEGSIHPSKEHPGRDVPIDLLRTEILQFIEDVEVGSFPDRSSGRAHLAPVHHPQAQSQTSYLG